MNAIRPLLDMIFGLEAFDQGMFWLALLTGFIIVGFFVDFLMGSISPGVLFCGIFVYIGVASGIFLKYNYFMLYPWTAYDPYLTVLLTTGPGIVLLSFAGFVVGRVR